MPDSVIREELQRQAAKIRYLESDLEELRLDMDGRLASIEESIAELRGKGDRTGAS